MAFYPEVGRKYGCVPERFVAPWAAHHGRVRIGVGVSTAPDARQAAVEAAAHARDELAGEAPSLAVLLASRSHTDQAVDVLDAVVHREPVARVRSDGSARFRALAVGIHHHLSSGHCRASCA